MSQLLPKSAALVKSKSPFAVLRQQAQWQWRSQQAGPGGVGSVLHFYAAWVQRPGVVDVAVVVEHPSSPQS